MTDTDYDPEWSPEVQCDGCAATGAEPCEGACRCEVCAPQPDPERDPPPGPVCPHCGGGPPVPVPTLGLTCKSCARVLVARRPQPEPDLPEPEPIDDGPDPRDEHDAWHPVWVEGCDGCIDRADELEAQHRVGSDAE